MSERIHVLRRPYHLRIWILPWKKPHLQTTPISSMSANILWTFIFVSWRWIDLGSIDLGGQKQLVAKFNSCQIHIWIWSSQNNQNREPYIFQPLFQTESFQFLPSWNINFMVLVPPKYIVECTYTKSQTRKATQVTQISKSLTKKVFKWGVELKNSGKEKIIVPLCITIKFCLKLTLVTTF